MESGQIDGIVLDWVLPEAEGTVFIETVQSKSSLYVPPIVVSGKRELSAATSFRNPPVRQVGPVRYAQSIERILDETVLLLHRKESALRRSSSGFLRTSGSPTLCWLDAKVLVTTTDLRNIFALTSVLEHRELKNPARRKRPALESVS